MKTKLKKLFQPQSVAVIGASTTPGKLGYEVFSNLVTLGYKGKLYPINPKKGELLKHKIYQNIKDVNNKIDLAIILIPAPFVLNALEDCGQSGIQNIIIISAGFKETGDEGIKREEQIKKLIKKYNFNLIGPNCLGIINTNHFLNASFAEGMPPQGNVSLISQSGAMAVAITDWAYTHDLGFSKIISLGNKAGVSEIELLEHLAQSEQTDVILMYLESIENGDKFMKIANEITQHKPIIVIKSGTSKRGTQAISSHTGSLAGSNQAINTALKQCGVIRANSVEDFFDFARGFSHQNPPSGKRVAIISNAGGPAIMATDAIENSELELAKFSPKTTQALQKSLPTTAAVHNPVDIIGDALADRYEIALKNILKDKGVDAVMVILTPQIMTEEMKTARQIVKYAQKHPNKTVLTCFMGGRNIKKAEKHLNENNIPNFAYPDRTVKTLEQMFLFQQRKESPKNPLKKPGRCCDSVAITLEGAEGCSTPESSNSTSITKKLHPDNIKSYRHKLQQHQGQISMSLAFELLELYDIHIPKSGITTTLEETISKANEIGYPVVLKICSDDIIHKTDAGGVRVNLKNAQEVKIAYRQILEKTKAYNPKAKIDGIFVQEMTTIGREVIIGMKRNPQFGPLLMFGLGGIYVEVLKDVTFRIAPISQAEARKMINEIQAIKLLRGIRGEKSIDFDKLAEIIYQISQMVSDFPEIQELDLNPVIVREKGKEALAIDARILV